MYFVDLPAGTAAGSPTGKRGRFQVVDTQALYGIDDFPAPPFVFNVEQAGLEPAAAPVRMYATPTVPYCAAAGYTADGLSALTVWNFEGGISRCRITGGEQGRIRTDSLPLCLRTFFPKITSRSYPPYLRRRFSQSIGNLS